MILFHSQHLSIDNQQRVATGCQSHADVGNLNEHIGDSVTIGTDLCALNWTHMLLQPIETISMIRHKNLNASM